MFGAFTGFVAASSLAVLVVVPLLYILTITAVFARDRERREAARRVLSMLWPRRGGEDRFPDEE